MRQPFQCAALHVSASGLSLGCQPAWTNVGRICSPASFQFIREHKPSEEPLASALRAPADPVWRTAAWSRWRPPTAAVPCVQHFASQVQLRQRRLHAHGRQSLSMLGHPCKIQRRLQRIRRLFHDEGGRGRRGCCGCLNAVEGAQHSSWISAQARQLEAVPHGDAAVSRDVRRPQPRQDHSAGRVRSGAGLWTARP